MSDIEKKRLTAEILRVSAAKAEMEYIIAQKQEEIIRLQDNIKKQEASEKNLKEKLLQLEGK